MRASRLAGKFISLLIISVLALLVQTTSDPLFRSQRSSALIRLLTQPALAGPPLWTHDLTYEGLKRLIEEHDIRTIDQLLDFAPKGLLDTGTYIFHSRSTQFASFDRPRVLLFARNLILGFSGDPQKRNYSLLEVMEIDPESGIIKPHSIEFPNDAGAESRINRPQDSAAPHERSKPIFIENPTNCFICHIGTKLKSDQAESDFRLIWEQYPLWDGVYGSAEDDPYINSQYGIEEKEKLRKFIDETKDMPRYRKLNLRFLLERDSPIFLLSKRNEHITDRLNRLNFRRIASQLKSYPSYDKFKLPLYFLLEKGEFKGWEFFAQAFPEIDWTKVERRFLEDQPKIKRRMSIHLEQKSKNATKPFAKKNFMGLSQISSRLSSKLDPIDENQADMLARVTALLTESGTPSRFLERWSLSFDRSALYFNSGYKDSTEPLAQVLYRDLVKTHPSLEAVLSSPHDAQFAASIKTAQQAILAEKKERHAEHSSICEKKLTNEKHPSARLRDP